jgi:hypothetical protein
VAEGTNFFLCLAFLIYFVINMYTFFALPANTRFICALVVRFVMSDCQYDPRVSVYDITCIINHAPYSMVCDIYMFIECQRTSMNI